jgi:predicted GNAT superfamily acetyltransferase
MIEGPYQQNNPENLEKLSMGQAKKVDIQGILQVQKERSLSSAVKEKDREDIERNGFLVHMLSEDELEKLIDTPQDVITITYKENEDVLGYAIGYTMKLWRELHPDWENGIHFLEHFGPQDIGENSVYFRHVATSQNAKAGIGAQISKELVRLSQEKGFTRILGEILKEPYLNRPSLVVHKRMGFSEIGEIDEVFEGGQYKWGLFRKMLVDENVNE